jgi:hypothetical protein
MRGESKMKIKTNLNYYILMLGLIIIGILLVNCICNPCFVEAAPGDWIDMEKVYLKLLMLAKHGMLQIMV